MEEKEIAVVTDFFAKVGVVALKVLNDEIKIGDKLHFKGHTTDFTEDVKSMQKEHIDIDVAKVGDDIGIKVSSRVRKHDKVYKVIE
ncbi:MAG: hypothetical protein AB1765_09265 [Candidatus Hydrogenedentota bacterium]